MTDPADLAIVELKQCPFCGGELHRVPACGGMPRHPRNNCFLSGIQFIGHRRTERAWNTRADSPEAAQCIEMLVAALGPLLGIIDEGVLVNISDKALREQHPDDRRFIKRTRKALTNANAALAKVRGR